MHDASTWATNRAEPPCSERASPCGDTERTRIATHGTPSRPPRATRSLFLSLLPSLFLHLLSPVSLSPSLTLPHLIHGGGGFFFSLFSTVPGPTSRRNLQCARTRSRRPHARNTTHPRTTPAGVNLRYICVFTWNLKRQKVKKMAALDGHTSICWVCGEWPRWWGPAATAATSAHFRDVPSARRRRAGFAKPGRRP